MGTSTYDLVVIGTGSSGSSIAHTCREAGWSVAILDEAPFGGTCALRGCDPKKVLVGAAQLVDWHRRMQHKQVVESDIRLDWPRLIEFKKSFTDPVPTSREDGFRAAGIDTYHGVAQFVDATTLQVNGDTLIGRKFALAAGARPVPLDIPGEEYITTSTQFMELEELPPRVIFIGGGYISFEFAHVAARAGAQAQILQRSGQPLSHFDPDLVELVVESTRQAGVPVWLDTAVQAIESKDDGYYVHAQRNGEEVIYAADLVVHGAGRVPAIEKLNLGAAGIESNKQGIVVNDFLQSVSNEDVYAAGDVVASGLPLTPVAGMEGKIVASNLLQGNHSKPDYRAIPSVVFTIPALARVGMTEADARESGRAVKVNHLDASDWYSSKRVGIERAAVKVIIDETRDEILGAHLFGPEAEEVINLFALAIRFGIPAGELRHALFGYPTGGSDVPYMLG